MRVIYPVVCAAASAATLFVLLVILAPNEKTDRASFEDLRASVAAGRVSEIVIDGHAYTYRERGASTYKRADGPEPDLALVRSIRAHAKLRFAR